MIGCVLAYVTSLILSSVLLLFVFFFFVFFFCKAEDGIGVLVRSRGLGDVYKRQLQALPVAERQRLARVLRELRTQANDEAEKAWARRCLLYTSDAADERSSVDLGGSRIIKKKKNTQPLQSHPGYNLTTLM